MIVRFLIDTAARDPDAPAVISGTERLSYGELLEAVRRDAARLHGAGVRAGSRVAVLDANTVGFLISTFSVAWLGAVLQPLNTRLSPRELAEILRDAETKVLLAGESLRSTAEPLAREVEGLEVLDCGHPFGARPAAQLPTPDPVPRDPGSLAHLYTTSGTTGRPKGVCLTHGNVVVHARNVVRELGIGPGDRWGHFAPMFHLADAWANLALTLVGGVHVLLPRFDADAALECIERDRVTLTNLVPTMLTRMVAAATKRSFDPASLRLILSGGAPITPALVRRVLQTFRCEYVQTYGMTETSPYLTLGILTDELRALPEPQRLAYLARTGRPFAGIDLEVVDEQGREVPRDDRTVGEIRVRGASVSPGYWRRPEETREVFRDGWLYTGDLAVIEEHGYVNIVDRKKDMILSGGENVYSAEVESVLAEHPAVQEVAVFALPDEDLGERVAAAIVLHEGERAEESELRAWCRERIAHYKVPREVRFLEELPRTGSGKVSKKVLREGR
ncbi:MAG TPA: long-chain-fatty-acid--CoA ligase [Planctomycetes bacterium]|nr:long-chain-fatty-acid--CoA ligase [Planctomycetota bacterium]